MRFPRSHVDRWRPAGTIPGYDIVRPEVGDMVAFERRAWTVVRVTVRDYEGDDIAKALTWRPEHRDQWRPYSISLHRVYGAPHEKENSRQEVSLRAPAFMRHRWERYDEGRVPLCSCCQHPWPCLMVDAKAAAERSAEVMADRMAKVMPGCCYGCGEPITQRQESITYPEENVDLPGYPPPRFHTRKSCRGARMSYARRREEAFPDLPPVEVQPETRMF